MADDLRADPVELARLAGDVLTASQQLRDNWASAQAHLDIPAAAFGNSAGAAGVAGSHTTTRDEADLTIGRQIAVLEGDVDRLYRVAFAYEKMEQDEAERLRREAAGIGGGTP
jgi:hypothetical protein